MRQRAARRLAWSVWALTFALMVGFMVVSAVTWGGDEDWFFGLLAFLSVMGYATVGAMIASRHPRNAIGWLFLYFGLLFLVGMASDEYTTRGLREGLPGISAAALVSQVGFPLALGALPLILLLFPSGRLSSSRWRPVAWGLVGSIVAATAGTLLRPGSLAPGLANPLGVESLDAIAGVLVVIGGVGTVSAAVLCVTGLVVRYRRAGGEERQQIRWLAYVGGTAATLLLLLFASEPIAPGIGDPLWIAFFLTIALGIPAASGVAILRYRLYDLDIVVKKTVVFGMLAAFITAAYVVVVIGIPTLLFGVGGGLRNTIPFLGAAALALAFSRSAGGGADSPTGWCTGEGPARTSSCRGSPVVWAGRTRWTTCCRGWPALWPRARAPPGPACGFGWDRSSGSPRPGRPRRKKRRRSPPPRRC